MPYVAFQPNRRSALEALPLPIMISLGLYKDLSVPYVFSSQARQCGKRAGATTRDDGLSESHAGHQLNVLSAIMWCWQAAIRYKSLNAASSENIIRHKVQVERFIGQSGLPRSEVERELVTLRISQDVAKPHSGRSF